MTGSFDVPLGVFAFDDAGSARGRRRGRSRGDELADGVAPEPPDGVARLRGKALGCGSVCGQGWANTQTRSCADSAVLVDELDDGNFLLWAERHDVQRRGQTGRAPIAPIPSSVGVLQCDRETALEDHCPGMHHPVSTGRLRPRGRAEVAEQDTFAAIGVER